MTRERSLDCREVDAKEVVTEKETLERAGGALAEMLAALDADVRNREMGRGGQPPVAREAGGCRNRRDADGHGRGEGAPQHPRAAATNFGERGPRERASAAAAVAAGTPPGALLLSLGTHHKCMRIARGGGQIFRYISTTTRLGRRSGGTLGERHLHGLGRLSRPRSVPQPMAGGDLFADGEVGRSGGGRESFFGVERRNLSRWRATEPQRMASDGTSAGGERRNLSRWRATEPQPVSSDGTSAGV